FVPSVDRIFSCIGKRSANTGIVDRQVQTSIILNGLLHYLLVVFGTGRVRFNENGFSARTRDLIDGLLTAFFVQVGYDYLCALLSIEDGNRPANARTGTCDDRCFVIQ